MTTTIAAFAKKLFVTWKRLIFSAKATITDKPQDQDRREEGVTKHSDIIISVIVVAAGFTVFGIVIACRRYY